MNLALQMATDLPLETEARRPDFSEVLSEIASPLASNAKKQHTELQFELSGTPLLVEGHRGRIKQGILNIGVSYLKMISGNGTLVV